MTESDSIIMDNFSFSLRNMDLKVTPKRLAILGILMEETVYLSPDEIWGKMKRRFRKIGLPTVYRNLEELSEGNIISKVNHPNRKLYYYLCKNRSHHHHFICLSCRKVEDINFCAAKKINKEVKTKLMGKVISHILQVNGLCKTCSEKSNI